MQRSLRVRQPRPSTRPGLAREGLNRATARPPHPGRDSRTDNKAGCLRGNDTSPTATRCVSTCVADARPGARPTPVGGGFPRSDRTAPQRVGKEEEDSPPRRNLPPPRALAPPRKCCAPTPRTVGRKADVLPRRRPSREEWGSRRGVTTANRRTTARRRGRRVPPGTRGLRVRSSTGVVLARTEGDRI